jgi:hypothetical protein
MPLLSLNSSQNLSGQYGELVSHAFFLFKLEMSVQVCYMSNCQLRLSLPYFNIQNMISFMNIMTIQSAYVIFPYIYWPTQI